MFVASFVGHSWPPMSESFSRLNTTLNQGTSGFWISGYLWASLTFFSTFLQTCSELNFMLKIKDFIENRLQHMGFLKNFAKILRASILSNVDRLFCFFLSSTSDYCILINPFHALVSFDTPENIRKPFHGASKESSGMKWVKFTRVCFIFRNHTQNRLVLHHSFLNMKTREACNVHKMLFSYIHACTQNANCIPWVPGKNG